MDINRIILSGKLVSEPTVQNIPPDKKVCTFKFLSIKSTAKNYACYIEVDVWNEWAEICSQLKMGDKILIKGSLIFIRWKDKKGVPQFKYKVVATEVIFLA